MYFDISAGSLILNAFFTDNENQPNFSTHFTTVFFKYSCSSTFSCGSFNFRLPKGTFLLQAWGAQGGKGSYHSNTEGGKGGFSRGILVLKKSIDVFVYVGGAGQTGGMGGFNGGGNTPFTDYVTKGGSGGGSSDIRVGSDSIFNRVIVAGGGGGTEYSSSPAAGWGGGHAGSNGLGDEASNGGGGGNQTTFGFGGKEGGLDGSFGYGGNAAINFYSGAGGGGWYGGGSGGEDGDGGGGSGYVFSSSTQSFSPSEFQLTSEFYLSESETLQGNCSFPSPYTIYETETGHSGNGVVSITFLAFSHDSMLPNPKSSCNVLNLNLLIILLLIGLPSLK